MLPDPIIPNEHGGHQTAIQHMQHVGNREYTKYYSFGFVRNPWDRAVSLYQYCLDTYLADRYKDTIDFSGFKSFVETSCGTKTPFKNIHMKPQSKYLFHGNKQVVDFVGRFENLEQDAQKIFEHIGVSFPSQMLHTNKTQRDDYQSYYDESTKKIIQSTFAEDIHNFGYQYHNLNS
jgi:hypothetical protein